ncbi:hypothetical protein FGB62_4g044 [Gracilaria domingensis]|nr:hypothetical protein FGB62_4g044 [Gracilaria domingensis]
MDSRRLLYITEYLLKAKWVSYLSIHGYVLVFAIMSRLTARSRTAEHICGILLSTIRPFCPSDKAAVGTKVLEVSSELSIYVRPCRAGVKHSFQCLLRDYFARVKRLLESQDMTTHVSETEQTHAFVHPVDGEKLPSLLRRDSTAATTTPASLGDDSSRTSDPFDAFDQMALHSKEYPIVCAHVTEDLKLCSEAIMRLRDFLSDYKNMKEPLCDAPESEVSTALKWLDTLQDLEEKKLICTVSVHAISRSNAEQRRSQLRTAPASSTSMFASNNPEVKQKLAAYAKQLNKIDTDINFLMQEIMEYWLECEENH